MQRLGIGLLQLLGFEITRKAVPQSLQSVDGGRGGWYGLTVREPFAGAWQRNQESQPGSALAYAPVFACVTLIANDIGKLRMKLVQETADGIWEEAENPAYSPVLRKPNHYQNRIEFFKSWTFSRLLNGNTYILKQRDNRRVVTSTYVLDPNRCQPLVAPNGDVYYQLKVDNLSRVFGDEPLIVPASEIIHDKYAALYHPLVGLTPLSACYLPTLQALKIQNNQTNFFSNGANPGGVLSAPGFIKQETADRLKEYWQNEFTGDNAGRVAILGDGLKYEQLQMNAVDAQLIEQLKLTAENVCTAFHVPPYKIGIGAYPPYNNIEALNTEYYSQALQEPIESIELLIDEGLSLPSTIGVEFDLDQLLRMDTQTRTTVAAAGIGAAVFSPNEARKRFFNLPPVKGGETPYLQQQNFSLGALADRDKDKPFAKAAAPTPPQDQNAPPAVDEPPDSADMQRAGEWLTKAFEELDALEREFA